MLLTEHARWRRGRGGENQPGGQDSVNGDSRRQQGGCLGRGEDMSSGGISRVYGAFLVGKLNVSSHACFL